MTSSSENYGRNVETYILLFDGDNTKDNWSGSSFWSTENHFNKNLYFAEFHVMTLYRGSSVRRLWRTTGDLALVQDRKDHWTRIFEALVPVPKVVADVLVFVHGLRGWWATFWNTKDKSQPETLGTKTRNLKIQNGEDRPAL